MSGVKINFFLNFFICIFYLHEWGIIYHPSPAFGVNGGYTPCVSLDTYMLLVLQVLVTQKQAINT